MKNCVVRSYRKGYQKTTDDLERKLSDDWIVKFITPFIDKGGVTEYIEYILEKEEK